MFVSELEYKNDGFLFEDTVLGFDNYTRPKGSHTTEKPQNLLEFLIRWYARIDGLILDPTGMYLMNM
jgi:hypothetical protein